MKKIGASILFCLYLIGFSSLNISCDDEMKKMDPNDTFPDYNPSFIKIDLPEYFPIMDIPEDNPLTKEGVALGRKLFYDPILSGDSSLSCAGCHKAEFAFSDDRRFSEGIDGSIGDRQAMSIMNIGWMKTLFWDGRAHGVEDQAFGPVENPIEMKDHWPNVEDKLQKHADYPLLFHNAFGTSKITDSLVVKAIAQFERTMVSFDALFDKEMQEEIFYTADEQDGYDLFFSEEADCFHCHGGVLLTDNEYHNNGLDEIPNDIGLELVTKSEFDRGKFKTPSLRNIELTSPYMHDGRFNTLEEVIDFYSEGLHKSSTIDPLMKGVNQNGMQFTNREKQALLAFLKTFTDTSFINNPAFGPPE